MTDVMRVLFGKCDLMKYSPTNPGSTLDVSGWARNSAYDDSSWIAGNGFGDVGSDVAFPDGRQMPNFNGTPSLGMSNWDSEITSSDWDAEGAWFRYVVDITADDIDTGVYIWASCDYSGSMYVNGSHIGFQDRHAFDVTAQCVVGLNVFAFAITDYAYPPPEPGFIYEAHEQAQAGLALDTFFWSHLQVGSIPNIPTCGTIVPSLRMRQRDDSIRAAGQPRNSPRSLQRSIRAGRRNRYF